MPTPKNWALILGASSGFGEAIGLALARSGRNVFGVHLDRKATLPNVERIQAEMKAAGARSQFFNVNAADPEQRAMVLGEVRKVLAEEGNPSGVDVLLHSLAFGALKPFITEAEGDAISRPQIDMTLDVMAHSLVYWTQDVVRAGLMGKGSHVYAMTSAGSHRIWPAYGGVSAAKAALESHCRQLAVELVPRGIAVNALRAGVTDTPALRKIPGNDKMIEHCLSIHPAKRLTTPEDVAKLVVALAVPGTTWLTGNVLGIDGGEDIVG